MTVPSRTTAISSVGAVTSAARASLIGVAASSTGPPGGVPVGTLAIGKAGAINAALLAASILALADDGLSLRLQAWRAAQTAGVAEAP